MMHDLHIALCASHPKSDHLPSPRIWPPFTTSNPLFAGNHYAVVCVYEFLFEDVVHTYNGILLSPKKK